MCKIFFKNVNSFFKMYRLFVQSWVLQSWFGEQVFFVDYGNRETIKKEDIKILPEDLLKIPPQAIATRLKGHELRNDKAITKQNLSSLLENRDTSIQLRERKQPHIYWFRIGTLHGPTRPSTWHFSAAVGSVLLESSHCSIGPKFLTGIFSYAEQVLIKFRRFNNRSANRAVPTTPKRCHVRACKRGGRDKGEPPLGKDHPYPPAPK